LIEKKIFTCFCLLTVLACGKKETIRDPSFCFNLVVTNPARQLKYSIEIRPPHSTYTTALIYLRRAGDHPDLPDYRVKQIVRRNLLDSIPIDAETFGEFSRLFYESDAWEKKDVIGQRTDGNAYRIRLQDSARTHTFSVMGENGDKALHKMIRYCMDEFENKFPPIPILDSDCEIDLTKVSRLDEKPDSLRLRVVKISDSITAHGSQNKTFSINTDAFLEMWQILENNKIWVLTDNRDYAFKYPVEYRLNLRRGALVHRVIVFAPSKLSDKRYYNAVNHIENMIESK
jgi:hypothetical protein